MRLIIISAGEWRDGSIAFAIKIPVQQSINSVINKAYRTDAKKHIDKADGRHLGDFDLACIFPRLRLCPVQYPPVISAALWYALDGKKLVFFQASFSNAFLAVVLA